MSLVDVVPYFDSKMIDLGYQSWDDEFNIDNIPRDLLDRSYHIEIGSIASGPASNTDFEFTFPVIITVHSCITNALGSSDATNDMMIKAHSILDSILLAEDRYGAELKQIYPVSINFEPISSSNDNIIRVRIEFGVQVNEEFRRVCP